MAGVDIDAENFPCDIIGPLFYEDDLLLEPLPLLAGQAGSLEKPGLGVELRKEALDNGDAVIETIAEA